MAAYSIALAGSPTQPIGKQALPPASGRALAFAAGFFIQSVLVLARFGGCITPRGWRGRRARRMSRIMVVAKGLG